MCDGCWVTLTDLIEITEKQKTMMEFLAAHGVLLKTVKCETCGKECGISEVDGDLFYRCQKRRNVLKNEENVKERCKFLQSTRNNTFFFDSHLRIKDICVAVYFELLLDRDTTNFFSCEFRWTEETANNWETCFWEVLIDWAVNFDCGKLGGQDKMVEVYETKVGKIKYNCGKMVEGQLVIVMFEPDGENLCIVPVKECSKDILFGIISNKILPETTIVSELWKTYDCLDSEYFLQLAVNMSINFIQPIERSHTQNIQQMWLNSKRYPDHRYRVHEVFKIIGKLYNPNNELKLNESLIFSNDKIDKENR